MRHTCQRQIQQAKTGILAMRYFPAWRYKRLVNDPACGIILPDDDFVTNHKSCALVICAGAIARFRDRGQVFDSNISALEAGIGAFPRRLMVDEARLLAAKTILADAGELYDD